MPAGVILLILPKMSTGKSQKKENSALIGVGTSICKPHLRLERKFLCSPVPWLLDQDHRSLVDSPVVIS